MPTAEIASASATPTARPIALPSDPEDHAFQHDQAEDVAPTVAERHHRSEFGQTLEGRGVDRVRNGQHDHQQQYHLQKPELPVEELHGLVVEVGQIAPRLHLVAQVPEARVDGGGDRVGCRRVGKRDDDFVDAGRAPVGPERPLAEGGLRAGRTPSSTSETRRPHRTRGCSARLPGNDVQEYRSCRDRREAPSPRRRRL